MNAEATVTNRIHVFRASSKKDAFIGTKAESAEAVTTEEVTPVDIGTNLQSLDGG